MITYLALLRGINVGGNSIIKMAELKLALSETGLKNVRTYIQSGNVIFDAEATDKLALAQKMAQAIKSNFDLDVDIIVLSASEWKAIIAAAPKWWGKDTSWKHNIIVMTSEFDMNGVVERIGVLKPDIEYIESGIGVIYQSLSYEKFGRTTSGKIASNPVYKHMTIRNYNTATKLAGLMEQS